MEVNIRSTVTLGAIRIAGQQCNPLVHKINLTPVRSTFFPQIEVIQQKH